MGDLIQLNDFRPKWKKALTLTKNGVTLHVYVDLDTGQVDLVQVNEEGEALRTELSLDDSVLLRACLVVKNHS